MYIAIMQQRDFFPCEGFFVSKKFLRDFGGYDSLVVPLA
jgi:hypothetical protein